MPYKRTYKRKATRKTTRKTFRKKRPTARLTRVIKSVALKQCETKRSSQYTEPGQNLFHNLAYYAGNLLATTQGVSDPAGLTVATRNRVGDEVIGRGISLKFFFQNASDRPNVMYRIIMFRYNTLQDIPTIPSVLSDQYFWSGTDGQSGNMNRTLDRPKTERVKILKEHWIYPEKQANYSIQTAGPVPVGPFVKTMHRHFWLPLNNQKIKYRGDNSNFARFTDIGFMVLAYDAITTQQTDNVSTFQWQSTFYYKDP